LEEFDAAHAAALFICLFCFSFALSYLIDLFDIEVELLVPAHG